MSTPTASRANSASSSRVAPEHVTSIHERAAAHRVCPPRRRAAANRAPQSWPARLRCEPLLAQRQLSVARALAARTRCARGGAASVPFGRDQHMLGESRQMTTTNGQRYVDGFRFAARRTVHHGAGRRPDIAPCRAARDDRRGAATRRDRPRRRRSRAERERRRRARRGRPNPARRAARARRWPTSSRTSRSASSTPRWIRRSDVRRHGARATRCTRRARHQAAARADARCCAAARREGLRARERPAARRRPAPGRRARRGVCVLDTLDALIERHPHKLGRRGGVVRLRGR